MKKTAVTCPDLKRDRDGRFTEYKLGLATEEEFIGVNLILRNKPSKDPPERKKRSYITF